MCIRDRYFIGADWIYFSDRGGQDAWNTESYLNIWLTRFSEVGNLMGFGSKPFENPPSEDGVVMRPDFFGTTGTVNPPFHLGKTAVHEIGHYFNIFHPWATSNSCEHDDFVADTPNQDNPYRGCMNNDQTSCGSRDITNNFMNLSEDECLVMFTKGQALRMQAALIGARSGLLNINACQPSTTPVLSLIHISEPTRPY